MAIIGQNYGRRRRPKGPIILAVLAVALIGLLALAWARGGEMPTQRVEKTIPLPAAAKNGGAASSTGAEG
ncbi:hypothetical protein C7451_11767 [Blastomonas natatoria]|uniref:Uncharacterized protein n=1 Tax=Blastomonas natatoria TaxID=34015 RepID=A0A2V3USV5_9SPHN|nr:hypothetical protein [Blastomonas natatoria]PXW68477.1 hypothetical protein C7451_11767 [Blastomonas natatoria]